MSQLKVSVGPGKPNLKADVLLVQKLLNASGAGVQNEPLKLDGQFGPKTAADILAYQALVLGIRRPDGVVDPGERTVRSLLRGAQQSLSAGRAAAVAGLIRGGENLARPSHVKAFIDFALPAARKVKREWGVPIAMVLAQSGLMTGWGKHVNQNAYFGIQGKKRSTDTSNFTPFEVVEGKRLRVKSAFRAYVDYADAADDYGRFLAETPRYRVAFRDQKDPVKFAETVALIGSASSPQNSQLLTRIIRSYSLDEYDRT